MLDSIPTIWKCSETAIISARLHALSLLIKGLRCISDVWKTGIPWHVIALTIRLEFMVAPKLEKCIRLKEGCL